jgi:hypothetical protein
MTLIKKGLRQVVEVFEYGHFVFLVSMVTLMKKGLIQLGGRIPRISLAEAIGKGVNGYPDEKGIG